MSKIKLREILISSEEKIDLDINGIKNKNKIIYKENDIVVTILILRNKITMTRVHEEYEIKLNFIDKEKTNGTYRLKDYNKIMDLEIKTNKLVIDNENIIIDYEIENNKFFFKLYIGGSYDN